VVLTSDSSQQLQSLTDSVESWASVAGLRINTEKTKSMKIGHDAGTWQLKVNGQPTECVDEFCYLGSLLTNTSSCDKEIRTRTGKANSAFKRLDCIWRQKTLGLPIKIRLYESIVLAILLYCAKTWAITEANRKRLEAFHHNCLRKLLNVTWKDSEE